MRSNPYLVCAGPVLATYTTGAGGAAGGDAGAGGAAGGDAGAGGPADEDYATESDLESQNMADNHDDPYMQELEPVEKEYKNILELYNQEKTNCDPENGIWAPKNELFTHKVDSKLLQNLSTFASLYLSQKKDHANSFLTVQEWIDLFQKELTKKWGPNQKYKNIRKQLGMTFQKAELNPDDNATLQQFIDQIKGYATNGQIDINFQSYIMDIAKQGPIYISKYDSQHLDFFFQLIARYSKYKELIKNLYNNPGEIAVQYKTDLAHLFYDCCRHLGITDFAFALYATGKRKSNPDDVATDNPISLSLCKAYRVPVIHPNPNNLLLNFGLILHICKRVVIREEVKMTQNIYIKVKDPKNMPGLSLY
jgi:hypothetical protein